MPPSEIPDDFYREAWTDVRHPLACVGVDNKFVSVNTAWEIMLGYSSTELQKISWVDLTKQSDVGGDLASVKAVLAGEIDAYTMEKDYIHKKGHLVPVRLTVRRFPRNPVDTLTYFSVEAPVATPTRQEADASRHIVEASLRDLEEKIRLLQQGVSINVDNQSGDRWSGGDKVGRDKSQNSTTVFKYVAAALIAIAAAVAYMAYAIHAGNNGQQLEPPRIINSEN